MITELYILEVFALIACDVTWICKKENGKIIYMLLTLIGMLICGLITYVRGVVGIYSFLITAIVALFNIITLYDIKTMFIPNELLLILNVMGLLSSFFLPNGMFLTSIIGAWIITGLCLLVGRKAKNGIGTGDLYCMSGLMMSMNFAGMMNFMFSSLLISVVYGIGALIFKKKTLKSEMAFAPFLLCGYLVMILCN